MLHIGDIVGLVSVTASVTGFQPGAGELILPMLPLKSLISRFTLNVAPGVSLLPSQVIMLAHLYAFFALHHTDTYIHLLPRR